MKITERNEPKNLDEIKNMNLELDTKLTLTNDYYDFMMHQTHDYYDLMTHLIND